MELKPENHTQIVGLLEKGVSIPNPLTLDVGKEVDIDRVSSKGVRLYPGCRIYGANTVISEGAQIGYEGPVTIEDCRIGPHVALKGGFFRRAVFLEGASMGSGAHVREGCLLEEHASGAHCVGLKQTILFPFVTLGSLINFCDCLMAGGTSRKAHSEVGSAYIHFNFSADGDKATASIYGDVPRGVMINQPPIFLGGQGGTVGPIRVTYGNVAVAGTILRKDALTPNRLLIGKTHRGGTIPFTAGLYPGISRLVEHNIYYLASLTALKQWYAQVRHPFFRMQKLGDLMYEGALEILDLAVEERLKRLDEVAQRMPHSIELRGGEASDKEGRMAFHRNMDRIRDLFESDIAEEPETDLRDRFLKGIEANSGERQNYLQAIQGLPSDISALGTAWLEGVINRLCRMSADMLPAMRLFRKL
ncbi:MAG: UDP-N-acetylglucosamine pyrophosphorylase [Deltaproteobacteria bacterium]|nr:UDP-N-acetylglucosamine pyrophosphorylase [Deltaproteobacteria bacterium]